MATTLEDWGCNQEYDVNFRQDKIGPELDLIFITCSKNNPTAKIEVHRGLFWAGMVRKDFFLFFFCFLTCIIIEFFA